MSIFVFQNKPQKHVSQSQKAFLEMGGASYPRQSYGDKSVFRDFLPCVSALRVVPKNSRFEAKANRFASKKPCKSGLLCLFLSFFLVVKTKKHVSQSQKAHLEVGGASYPRQSYGNKSDKHAYACGNRAESYAFAAAYAYDKYPKRAECARPTRL